MPFIPHPPLLWALVIAAALPVTTATAHDITVKVERQGGLMVLDVRAVVAASAADTWGVLTDYEHMPVFMSMVKSSSVARHSATHWEVSQTGTVKFGVFTFTAASVRSIDLVPMREIRSHLIGGDFKTSNSLTQLSDQGSGTLIVHHGEYEPKAWTPPFLGTSVVEGETRRQYEQLLSEILRRRLPGSDMRAVPASPTPAIGVP